MITKIKYSTLDQSITEASEIYFWYNAMKISPKFLDGFIDYQTKWIEKRTRPFLDGNYEAGSLIFGTSFMKNKPVVMMNIKE